MAGEARRRVRAHQIRDVDHRHADDHARERRLQRRDQRQRHTRRARCRTGPNVLDRNRYSASNARTSAMASAAAWKFFVGSSPGNATSKRPAPRGPWCGNTGIATLKPQRCRRPARNATMSASGSPMPAPCRHTTHGARTGLAEQPSVHDVVVGLAFEARARRARRVRAGTGSGTSRVRIASGRPDASPPRSPPPAAIGGTISGAAKTPFRSRYSMSAAASASGAANVSSLLGARSCRNVASKSPSTAAAVTRPTWRSTPPARGSPRSERAKANGAAGRVREVLADRPSTTRPPRELLHTRRVPSPRPAVNGRKSHFATCTAALRESSMVVVQREPV